MSFECRRTSGLGIRLVAQIFQRRLAYLFIWLFSFLCGGIACQRHENQQKQGDCHQFPVWPGDHSQWGGYGAAWVELLEPILKKVFWLNRNSERIPRSLLRGSSISVLEPGFKWILDPLYAGTR